MDNSKTEKEMREEALPDVNQLLLLKTDPKVPKYAL